MTKHFQKILTASAVALFVLAFLLDLSYFSQDWKSFWKSVDVTRFAIIIAIIAAVGLVLALFPFRKKTYGQRLLLTLPIAFILFSLANISKTAIDYYGLNEDYNYFKAKRDIRNGKVQILETGLLLAAPNLDWEQQQAIKKITEKHFGYSSVYLGCTVTNGIDLYNEVMEEHLNKINGNDWRAKEQHMLDSILKLGAYKQ